MFFFIDQYWNENGPIFFYTGNEGPITGFWDNSGFVFEAAEKFNALVIFGEHVSNRQNLFVCVLRVVQNICVIVFFLTPPPPCLPLIFFCALNLC